jgi:hypothetical protein
MPRKTTNKIEQTDLLTVGDIRDRLTSFAAAIRSDVLSVVPIHYDVGMWSRWRSDNLKFLNKLIETTNEIPEATLSRLGRLARGYPSAVVAYAVLELLAEAASGSVVEVDVLPAARFFELVIGDVSRRKSTGSPQINGRTRDLMALWFPLKDPLQIAKDPECRITTK